MTLPRRRRSPRKHVSPIMATGLHVRHSQPRPSTVYDTLWRFACERQTVFFRRLAGEQPPWTRDPIIQDHRFTNTYRAADRVSQYLIRHVIYRDDLPSSDVDLFFRVVLFKLFNRIATWEMLQEAIGDITVSSFNFDKFARVLTRAHSRGHKLYSAAYIMPSTGVLGERIKHRGHLRLVERLLQEHVAEKVKHTTSLGAVFALLRSYPTLGNFLAFQLSIDLNYSTLTNFSEMDFVVAGPGAMDGLRKCFTSFGDYSESDMIRWVADRQESDTHALGLDFQSLFGRRLQLVDVQNLFCEVGKYARVAHPGVRGTSDRTRIKQLYRPGQPLARLFFPPKWRINGAIPEKNMADAGLAPNADQSFMLGQ